MARVIPADLDRTKLVWRSATHHIHIAFLTVNGIISLLLGATGILEVILSA